MFFVASALVIASFLGMSALSGLGVEYRFEVTVISIVWLTLWLPKRPRVPASPDRSTGHSPCHVIRPSIVTSEAEPLALSRWANNRTHALGIAGG